MSTNWAVEFKKVSKQFGDCVSNSDVDLQFGEAQIHGLIGENGAGKSTAMKMLFGMEKPTTGEIFLFGKKINFESSEEALAAGIGMVHQHFMLAENISVLENLLLFLDRRKFGFISHRKWKERLEKQIQELNFNIDLNTLVKNLTVGQQQQLEIIKCLLSDSKIIIMDEPTAVLTPSETTELLQSLKKLKAAGITIIIVSHKLKEIMEVTDTVTVLRRGRVVAATLTSATSVGQLGAAMVGQALSGNLGHDSEFASSAHLHDSKDPVLKIKNLNHQTTHGQTKNLSFEIKAGEIFGVAGVEGNGQEALIDALVKANRSKNSSVEMQTPVSILPEDRLKVGVLPNQSALRNFLLGYQSCDTFQKGSFGPFQKGFGIDQKKLKAAYEESVKSFDIRPTDPEITLSSMSGGNQQKLVVARELYRKPKFLVAAHPTRGVDIGAIELIHAALKTATEAGAGVLLISSELDELFKLSDRIGVLYKGEFVQVFHRGHYNEASVGKAMGGHS